MKYWVFAREVGDILMEDLLPGVCTLALFMGTEVLVIVTIAQVVN